MEEGIIVRFESDISQFGQAAKECGNRDQRAACQDWSIDYGAWFFSKGVQSLSIEERRNMINEDQTLSKTTKCELVDLNRSTLYYKSAGDIPKPDEVALCLLLDKLYMKHLDR